MADEDNSKEDAQDLVDEVKEDEAESNGAVEDTSNAIKDEVKEVKEKEESLDEMIESAPGKSTYTVSEKVKNKRMQDAPAKNFISGKYSQDYVHRTKGDMAAYKTTKALMGAKKDISIDKRKVLKKESKQVAIAKRKRENLEAAQLKYRIARGPTVSKQIGQSVAGIGTAALSPLGFTRYGVVGKEVEKREIARKQATVTRNENMIKGLTSLRNAKKRNYMKDGKINSTEKVDLDRLMKQIDRYTNLNKTTKKGLGAKENLRLAKEDQAFNQSFQYVNTETGKFIENQKGGAKTSRGTKGKKLTKEELESESLSTFGGIFTKRKNMRKDFEKNLQREIDVPAAFAELQGIPGLPKMTEEQQAVAPKFDMEGRKITRKNSYGVEDWILGM